LEIYLPRFFGFLGIAAAAIVAGEVVLRRRANSDRVASETQRGTAADVDRGPLHIAFTTGCRIEDCRFGDEVAR
jgi:hypothetical protein